MPGKPRGSSAPWSIVARAGARSLRHGRVPGARVAGAFGTLATIRLALWIFPYRDVDAYLARRRQRLRERARAWQRERAHAATPSQIAWRVAIASRVVPRSTCLVNALAGQQLMAADGYDTVVRFGVRVAEPGASGWSAASALGSARPGFAAHAWLELDGHPIIGGDVSGFQTFRGLAPVARE